MPFKKNVDARKPFDTITISLCSPDDILGKIVW